MHAADVPELRIKIDGASLPPEAETALNAVSVFEDVDAPSMFTLQLWNWDQARLRVAWSDGTLFAVGASVDVGMGYPNRVQSVMVGEIIGLEAEFSAEQSPMLTVRGYDRRHRLMRARATRSFTKVKDSDIASQLAAAVGLRAQTTDTRVKYEYVLQNNQTDFEFLLARARRIGYEVVVQDRTLLFRPRQTTQSPGVVLTLDQDLLSFSTRLSSLGQLPEVRARGWDPTKKKAIVGGGGPQRNLMGGARGGPAAAKAAFGTSTAVLVDQPFSSAQEADQVAQAQLEESALGYITGEGTTVGRTDLRAGTVIQINGVGTRFSGNYYVTATRHTLDSDHGYRTAFSARRSAST